MGQALQKLMARRVICMRERAQNNPLRADIGQRTIIIIMMMRQRFARARQRRAAPRSPSNIVCNVVCVQQKLPTRMPFIEAIRRQVDDSAINMQMVSGCTRPQTQHNGGQRQVPMLPACISSDDFEQ